MGNLANFCLLSQDSSISFISFLDSCFVGGVYSNIFILLINIAIMFSSFGVAHGIIYATVNNLFSSLPCVFKNNINFVKFFVFALIPIYVIFLYYNN
jgi:hypothetical protein